MVTCHGDMSRHVTTQTLYIQQTKGASSFFSQVHSSSALQSNIARHTVPFLKRPQWSAGTATAVSAPGVKAPLGGRSLGRIKMQAPGAPTTPLAQSGRMPRRVRRPGRSTGPKTTWAALRRRQAHVVRLVYGAECVHGGCTGSSAAHLSAGRMACSATRAR